MIAARLVGRALELVIVVAQRADHFEPARVVALPLEERARHGAHAVRRRHFAVAGRIEVVHLVAEQVAAIGERVAEVAEVEPRRVVEIEALGVDLEAAVVADEAGDRIAEAARRAVLDLELILRGRVPVDVAVEIEELVVRLAVAIARGQDVGDHVGEIDRLLVGHVLPGAIAEVLGDRAELDLVPFGGTERDLAEARPGLVAAVRHDVAVAVLVGRVVAVGAAEDHVDVLVRPRGAEERAEHPSACCFRSGRWQARRSARPAAARPRRPWCGTTPRRRSRPSRRCWRPGRARRRPRRPVPDRGRTGRWRCGRSAGNSAARRRPPPRRGRSPAGRGC